MRRVVIGIDPGVKTGLAVINHGLLEKVMTLDFWNAIKHVEAYLEELKTTHEIDIRVYIEDPNLNKPVFDRGQRGRKALNIAQKVGSNKRDAQLLIEFCNLRELPVLAVRPVAGPFTKMTAEFFKRQTGWNGRTSQHARDAAGLILGR